MESEVAIETARIVVGANRRNEGRPVDRKSKIDADRPDRSRVSQAETHGVREVIQFVCAIELALGRVCGIENRLRRIGAKRYAAQATVDVATVIKQRATQ